MFAGRHPDPTPAEADRLARALLERDEPSDRLVRAIREDGTVTLAQFRHVLEHGVDDDTPAPLREYFALLEDTPTWVDRDAIALGARTLRRVGRDVGDVLAYGSLLGGYNNSGPLPVLVSSGKLTGDRTLRRITETGVWWQGCVADGGLDRFGAGFTLTVHVRLMHALIAYHHERNGWDTTARGLPVNQFDQAGTLGLFSTSFLLHTRVLGVRYTAREADAVMHLWRYVGWLMGVDDQWLVTDERAGRRLLYQIGLASPPADDDSYALAKSLVDVPLRAQYPRFAALRRRYEYERGLSLATTLLGPAGVRALRVPVRPPWYPVLRTAVNVAKHHVVGRVPAGRRALQRLGEHQIATSHERLIGHEKPSIASMPA
nr:oxygenase MpaB family protein [Rhodococcus sp. HNM0569]